MLRTFLDQLSLLHLPIVVMVLFLSFFVGVVWRVTRRARREIYQRMARMPLEDRAERSHR